MASMPFDPYHIAYTKRPSFWRAAFFVFPLTSSKKLGNGPLEKILGKR